MKKKKKKGWSGLQPKNDPTPGDYTSPPNDLPKQKKKSIVLVYHWFASSVVKALNDMNVTNVRNVALFRLIKFPHKLKGIKVYEEQHNTLALMSHFIYIFLRGSFLI